MGALKKNEFPKLLLHDYLHSIIFVISVFLCYFSSFLILFFIMKHALQCAMRYGAEQTSNRDRSVHSSVKVGPKFKFK